jgi:hypothetical protein
MVDLRFSTKQYNSPVPISITSEEQVWESFKRICALRKVKPNIVITSLMNQYVLNAEEYGLQILEDINISKLPGL